MFPQDSGLKIDEVGGLERVSFVVGKTTIKLKIHRNNLDTAGFSKDGRHRQSRHPVGRIDHDAKGSLTLQRNQAREVRGVVRQNRK